MEYAPMLRKNRYRSWVAYVGFTISNLLHWIWSVDLYDLSLIQHVSGFSTSQIESVDPPGVATSRRVGCCSYGRVAGWQQIARSVSWHFWNELWMDWFLMGIVDCICIVNHSQTVKKNRSSQLSNSKVCESKILTHTGSVYDCVLYIMPFVLGMYSNSKTALSPSFNIQKVATREPRNIITCTRAMAQTWDGCSFSKSSMKLIYFMVKHLEHIPVQPCSKALFAGRNAYIASWEISPGNWVTSIFSEGSLKRRSFDVDVLFYYLIPLNTQKTDKKKNTIFGLHMFPPYF